MVLLGKKLKRWQSVGLISAQQVQEILSYEARKFYYLNFVSLFALGICILGLGVISIIAANWGHIPASVKLAVDFIVLILFSLWLMFLKRSNRPLSHDLVLLFYFLFLLASIGLVAQVYHLSGPLYQALLFWAVITFPLTLHSQYGFIKYFWFSLFVTSLPFQLLEWSDEFTRISSNDSYWLLTFNYPYMLLLFSFIAGLYKDQWYQKIAQYYALIAFLSVVIGCDISLSIGNNLGTSIDANSLSISLVLGVIALFFIIFFNRGTWLKMIKGMALLLYIAVMLSVFLFKQATILGALFTILFLFAFAMYAIHSHNQRLYHLFIFLIGVRFFFIYLNEMHGLMTTGIGLVVSGLLIVLMVWLWHKFSTSLFSKLQRIIN